MDDHCSHLDLLALDVDSCSRLSVLKPHRRAGELGRPVHLSTTTGVCANVPSVNTIPKNAASWGIGAVVALVSGPRSVRCAVSPCRVTTISQWGTATEMNDPSSALRVCHANCPSGERVRPRSNLNNSIAGFMNTWTDHER